MPLLMDLGKIYRSRRKGNHTTYVVFKGMFIIRTDYEHFHMDRR